MSSAKKELNRISSQTVDKLEFVYIFLACTNLEVDWNVGHSFSAGGPALACGVSLTRYSRRSHAHPLQSTMLNNLDRTPFTYSLKQL